MLRVTPPWPLLCAQVMVPSSFSLSLSIPISRFHSRHQLESSMQSCPAGRMVSAHFLYNLGAATHRRQIALLSPKCVQHPIRYNFLAHGTRIPPTSTYPCLICVVKPNHETYACIIPRNESNYHRLLELYDGYAYVLSVWKCIMADSRPECRGKGSTVLLGWHRSGPPRSLRMFSDPMAFRHKTLSLNRQNRPSRKMIGWPWN